jgi:ornithine decarboxylase
VGSQQRDVDGWARALATATGVIEALERRGIRLGLLNLGGGFPAHYTDPIPAIGSIAAVIRRHLAPLAGRVDRVIAEPGRSMVADAGVLATSVVTATEREVGTRWLYVDAGVYGGLAETLGEAIRYRIMTTRDGDPTGTVVIAGPSCDSTDVMYEKSAYQLPVTLTEGDQLHLLATGAYTTSYASTGFNGFAPPTTEVVGAGRA